MPGLSSAQLQLTLSLFVIDSDEHETVSAAQTVLNIFLIFSDFQVNVCIPIWCTLIFLSAELSVHFRNQIYKRLWLLQSSKILEAFLSIWNALLVLIIISNMVALYFGSIDYKTYEKLLAKNLE